MRSKQRGITLFELALEVVGVGIVVLVVVGMWAMIHFIATVW